jgi:hypothetical protein
VVKKYVLWVVERFERRNAGLVEWRRETLRWFVALRISIGIAGLSGGEGEVNTAWWSEMTGM